MIKKRELREMELERKARCGTVSVAVPGIVRGFDAMHVVSTEGKAYWLVAADASIPHRTSIATVRARHQPRRRRTDRAPQREMPKCLRAVKRSVYVVGLMRAQQVGERE